jgi:hypothetical protein
MSAAMDLPRGIATGVGSMPGDDPLEAARIVFGELPDLPHIPELPNRGAGAEMIGRTAGLLADLPVDIQPSGWRMVPRPGRDLRRTRDLLARDLDALEEIADGHESWLKLQVVGPWTMAASVELHRGDKLLADPGATRDLAQSLAEGIRQHVADVRRRVPGATVLMQLDEPALPAVLAGRVPTASGFDTLDAVEETTAEESLGEVVAALDAPVLLHCCAPDAPIELMLKAGAAALSLDVGLLSERDDERIGLAIEGGARIFLGLRGVADERDAEAPAPKPSAVAEPALALWRRLGFPVRDLAETVTLTPSCGLAGASPDAATRALGWCREAARVMGETA